MTSGYSYKQVLGLLVPIWLSLASLVNGNAGVFTYYETPMFYRIGNDGFIMAHEPEVGFGPSQWRNIIFPPVIAPSGNQCGGIGQTTGYGQSPIVIPQESTMQCHTDMRGYDFVSGTCRWDQLEFRILLNGVIVGPRLGETCSLGRMRIPGNPNYFNALQYHIHTGSEHSVDGKYYQAELHVVHQEETQESFAVFGMFIDEDPNGLDEEHGEFEYFLKGWEAVAQRNEEYCAVRPLGSQQWGPNSVFESRQMKVMCDAPGTGINAGKVEWDKSTDMPVLKHPDFPDYIPHIYEDLPTDGYGIYGYRGGLTTPPCTEIVNWNLLDTPLYASREQINRLYKLILCATEVSTCKHSTIANEAGLTNRPVQALQDRKVLHRCPATHNLTYSEEYAAEAKENDDNGVAVPLPPVVGYAHNQVMRCVLGGDGGPLFNCWIDTVREHFALLYPWFVLMIGVVGFYLLSRYLSWFPFTALMFILGVVMGICSVTVDTTDQLSQSIRMWEDIGAEIILLGFLPGLIFRDAYTSNVFLFQKAFTQCLVMAFPMVLCGTCLTALVGYYILPYDWSWAFAMTFGAILSATDPVAVSVLLNEVGAPPRLRTHVSGESLLNDGSAIVFFTIFSQIFEFELGVPGFGTDIDLATGVGLFFRMSLGAVAIGLCFSAGLLFMVYLLNRKFNYEESIVQVMSSITAAYLCYYTADAVLGMSGVIAVLTLGVTTKFFADSLFNDPAMMEKFWVLVEHMLNSVLFTLGGMTWGRIISNEDPYHEITFHFHPEDFGYIVLVFVLLNVIRAFLIAVYYPIIKRMGLGSNRREATFMAWSGLRGAVGIALAIHLDKHISHQFFQTDPRRRYTTQLFGIVGGCSFLSLIVNGPTCGPLLKMLGLAKTGESRHKIVESYREDIKKKMFTHLLKLLGDARYRDVDWGAIKKHISFFDNLSVSEIRFAVKSFRENTPILEYEEPNLATFKPFLSKEDYREISSLAKLDRGAKLRAVFTLASTIELSEEEREALVRYAKTGSSEPIKDDEEQKEGDKDENDAAENVGNDEAARFLGGVLDETDGEENERRTTDENLIELRKVFVDLLSKAYDGMFASGEADVRNVRMVVAYKTAVEVARDDVASGLPFNDWEAVARVMTSRARISRKLGIKGKRRGNSSAIGESVKIDLDGEETNAKDLIHFSSGFIEAHQRAQKQFKAHSAGLLLTDSQIQVLEESQNMIDEAEAHLDMIDSTKMKMILAHLVCQILLNKAGEWIGDLNERGMMKDQEAEHFLEEIQLDIDFVNQCHGEWVLLPCADEEIAPPKEYEGYSGIFKSGKETSGLYESIFGQAPGENHDENDLQERRETLISLLNATEDELKHVEEGAKSNGNGNRDPRVTIDVDSGSSSTAFDSGSSRVKMPRNSTKLW